MSLSTTYPNFPLLSLPIAAGIAYAPHFIRALVRTDTDLWLLCRLLVLRVGYHAFRSIVTVSPRGQLEKVETRMTKAAWAMAKRAEGAHINGLETLPIYYGAILAALQAGVPKDTINYYASFFLIARVVFNAVYILNNSQLTALVRTAVWTSSIGACVKLFLAAAATKY